ncbi:DUF2079 domain-containing protein [Streptomyces sp. NPDC046866]|uniref:DUF2079 domain-containing protein n=1 Tax=Streptomyces sp. NPDC046866 TaxID=3154921 RepID=UPI0034518E49
MHAPPTGTTGTPALPPQQSGTPPRAAAQGPAAGPSARRPAPPWWMWSVVCGLFLVHATLSLRLHEQLLSNSFDLAIFEQGVRSYAHGHLPVSEVKGPGFPLLGDHFSPVLALLAPFYRLWPSPRTLLVAQAALVAVSALPLMRWAHKALGTAAALVFGLCYGLSWGIASAVGFDFHEWAFAVPLLACSLCALGQGRLRAAVLWALPMLLVKEDMGLTVAVIALLAARSAGPGRRRWLGIAAAAGSVGCMLLTLLVVLPAFNPAGSYAYTADLGGFPPGAGGGIGRLLEKATVGLVTPETKVATLVMLLAPTLFLALRSPLVLVAVPTVLWRGLSEDSSHWGTGFHYSLTLMPIVFAAFLDALLRRGTTPAGLRRYLAGAAGVCLMLLPVYSLGQLLRPAFWKTDPRVAVAHRVLDRIPDGATVQASNHLVPQLADRTSVSLFGWGDSRPDPQWVVVDTAVSPQLHWPLDPMQELVALSDLRASGYRTVAEENGFVLLTRTR